MTIRVSIRNDEPEGSARAALVATVVTVGKPDVGECRHVLAPGQAVEVTVDQGQFVMLDQKEA